MYISYVVNRIILVPIFFEEHKLRKLTRYHHYYRRKGIYTFVRKSSFKLIIGLSLLVIIFLLLKNYLPNFNTILKELFSSFSSTIVLSTFFISESLLGILPPDLFILWAGKTTNSYVILGILASCSYLGGIVSYGIGMYLGRLSFINNWINKKFSKYLIRIKEWGGIVIVIAALFPLPFSPICIVAGLVRFPFSTFLLLSAFRFLRFFGYALVLFNII